MASWHKYLQPPGDFERLYQAEDEEGFDAWSMSDLRVMEFQLVDMLVSSRAFNSILDIGCGKGSKTHKWAIPGRKVVGFDVSETAIRKARSSFPDVDFRHGDGIAATASGEYELAVCSYSLVYQEEWRRVIVRAAACADWIIVNEYITSPTHWHIPSLDDLIRQVETHFKLHKKMVINDDRVLLMGRSRARF